MQLVGFTTDIKDTQGFLNNTASSVNVSRHEGNVTVTLPSQNSWVTRVMNERQGTESFNVHIVDYVRTTEEVIFILEPCTAGCSTVGVQFTQPTSKCETKQLYVASIKYCSHLCSAYAISQSVYSTRRQCQLHLYRAAWYCSRRRPHFGNCMPVI